MFGATESARSWIRSSPSVDGRLQRWYLKAEAYDHTVVPNGICAARYPNLPPSRLHVLGSPRFNRQWLMQLADLRPLPAAPVVTKKPRIVMFLRNRNFPVHWEEVGRAIEIIVQSGPVDMTIKHHTRDKDLDSLIADHPFLAPGRHEGYEVIVDEVGSSELLGTSDVVLDLGTSVAFAAVLRGIPVLALEYLHANRGTLAEFMPETEIKSRDDLVQEIGRFHHGESWVYSPESLDRFVNVMIEPEGPDVLGLYSRLVTEARVSR